jgi:hypothetical protein
LAYFIIIITIIYIAYKHSPIFIHYYFYFFYPYIFPPSAPPLPTPCNFVRFGSFAVPVAQKNTLLLPPGGWGFESGGGGGEKKPKKKEKEKAK